MAQLQAQIVVHGETDSGSVIVEDAEVIYSELYALGVWPLDLLMEARAFADEQTINEVLGRPVKCMDEFEPSYRVDPDNPKQDVQIFVDPKEFMAVGVDCMFHRHITVQRVIPVDELPPLVVLESKD